METHLIPGARFVDPKVLARIKDLDFLAKSVVDGFINGLHRAPSRVMNGIPHAGTPRQAHCF